MNQTTIGKKAIAMLAAAVCVIGVFAGCGSKGGAAGTETMKEGQTVQTVVDRIAEEVGVAMPAPVDDAALENLMYIKPEDAEAYAGSIAMVMTSADNVVAVQAKEGKIDTVKAGLEKRLEDVRKSFENYLPEQSDKAQKGQVIVKGNYAFLLIVGEMDETLDADMEKAVKIINDAF